MTSQQTSDRKREPMIQHQDQRLAARHKGRIARCSMCAPELFHGKPPILNNRQLRKGHERAIRAEATTAALERAADVVSERRLTWLSVEDGRDIRNELVIVENSIRRLADAQKTKM